LKVEAAAGRLRGGGYKLTPQRMAVLEALAAEQHQSFEELRGRCRGIGVVTLYRTLDLLAELGIVRRLELGDRPRYELSEPHHHHLICESCGSISEFDECPLDAARLPAAGFEVHSHSLEVYGRCVACK
jgi:Fur family ferric uptake transcriptional regulator